MKKKIVVTPIPCPPPPPIQFTAKGATCDRCLRSGLCIEIDSQLMHPAARLCRRCIEEALEQLNHLNSYVLEQIEKWDPTDLPGLMNFIKPYWIGNGSSWGEVAGYIYWLDISPSMWREDGNGKILDAMKKNKEFWTRFNRSLPDHPFYFEFIAKNVTVTGERQYLISVDPSV